jgi:hypothetical protein
MRWQVTAAFDPERTLPSSRNLLLIGRTAWPDNAAWSACQKGKQPKDESKKNRCVQAEERPVNLTFEMANQLDNLKKDNAAYPDQPEEPFPENWFEICN